MTNRKIRIIKKSDTVQNNTNVQVSNQTDADSQRKLVQAVSEWAREFQERRRKESEHAYRRFIPNSAQTI